jgi:hypothetical protein
MFTDKLKCVTCGGSLPVTRNTRKYCSDVCRQKAHRKVKLSGNIPSVLMQFSEICSLRKNMIPVVQEGTYIYFLFDNDVIVYIGQTKSILQRIGAHISFKSFNSVSIVEVAESEQDVLERLYIEEYKPKYNERKHGMRGPNVKYPIKTMRTNQCQDCLDKDIELDVIRAKLLKVETELEIMKENTHKNIDDVLPRKYVLKPGSHPSELYGA